MHLQHFFHSIFGPVYEKVTYGNWDNMTMGTAILYPAGCISDILNKVGICGKSVKRVVSHPLSALGKDLTNMAVL